MDIQNLSIETDRLLLLPTIQNHAQDVFDNLDEETTKYLTILKTNKIEDTIAWIETVLEKRNNQEELQMTFFDKSSKEFIGNIDYIESKPQLQNLVYGSNNLPMVISLVKKRYEHG